MSDAGKSFYVTTPIYYVNDVPHVGHTYTTVAADALARYHRARGHATWFLTGTDEHGEKIEEVAKKNGTTPQAWADRTVVRFKDAWTKMEIANDDFIRTTDPRHEKVVAEMWKRMDAAGDLYLGEFEGKYCVGCEEKKNESELVDGFCPLHPGRALKIVKEASWYFRMSKYQDRLLAHFEKNPDFVVPESRRNEIVSFVKGGLRDLSVSRTTFSWGIPVPGDPKHVIYVWIDALTNYVSALGGPGAEKYGKFWGENTVHIIGKDILRFHAVYWPCMLMSAGLPLPRQIMTHGWWTVRGQKISKSLPATKVDPNVLADDIGADVLRYFLLNEIPLGQDGDFSYEALIARNNSDLANDLGNLVNRTIAMCEKYFSGKVPAAHPELDAREPHATLAAHARRAREGAENGFDSISPHDALKAIWELVRAGNKYVDTTAPWTLAKDPAKKQELEHAVHSFLEAALWAAQMASPVMPVKCDAILTQLGVPKERRAQWPREWNRELPAGTTLGKAEPVFPRIDDKREAALLAKWIPPEALAKDDKKPEAAPQDGKKKAPAGPAAEVSFDDFAKLELRVALVKAAERVPGKDKLLKLALDIGTGTRQVVAGIALAYAPEALVGKKVIFLANLAPAKIGGIESQGMVLAAGDEKILGLSAIDVDVPPGTRVR